VQRVEEAIAAALRTVGLAVAAVALAAPSWAVEPSTGVTLPDFVDLAKPELPAVVNISSTSTGGEGGGVRRGPGGPRGGAPGSPEEFWGRSIASSGLADAPPAVQGEEPRLRLRDRSPGLDPHQHHVIEDADEIVVKLADGTEHRRRCSVRDKKTDIALIRIAKPAGRNAGDARRLGAPPGRRVGDGDRQPVRARE